MGLLSTLWTRFVLRIGMQAQWFNIISGSRPWNRTKTDCARHKTLEVFIQRLERFDNNTGALRDPVISDENEDIIYDAYATFMAVANINRPLIRPEYMSAPILMFDLKNPKDLKRLAKLSEATKEPILTELEENHVTLLYVLDSTNTVDIKHVAFIHMADFDPIREDIKTILETKGNNPLLDAMNIMGYEITDEFKEYALSDRGIIDIAIATSLLKGRYKRKALTNDESLDRSASYIFGILMYYIKTGLLKKRKKRPIKTT